LLVGYSGMVSFGHAGFYAVGAYTFALLTTNGLANFWIAFILAIIAAVLFAAFVGFFAVKLVRIYFALFLLACNYVIYAIVVVEYEITRGDDGIIGIPLPDILNSTVSCYYFILVIVTISLILLYLVGTSQFGMTLESIRENRERARFIGINVRQYTFTGVAGILMAVFSRSAFPEYGAFMLSGIFLFVGLIGGVFNFIGPTFGAFIYTLFDAIITKYGFHWPLILGIGIILVVLFFRNGVVGVIDQKYRDLKLKQGMYK